MIDFASAEYDGARVDHAGNTTGSTLGNLGN
jgi:hypothetical protein